MADIIKKLFSILSKRQKRSVAGLGVMILIGAILETMGVSMIVQKRSKPLIPFWNCSTKLTSRLIGSIKTFTYRRNAAKSPGVILP